MDEYLPYRKTEMTFMRDYVPGENMDDIGVGIGITPEGGGFVARDPYDHTDKWYVSPEYFEANYEEG